MEQQQKPVDLANTTPIVCDSCDGQLFHEAFIIRKESRLMSGLPFDRTVPVAIIACIECGAVVESSIPQPLKAEFSTVENKQ
jgi:uncharacterized Zn finger protein